MATMTVSSTSIERQVALLQIIQQSVRIRRHIEIFLWLNGELQRFLPHEILLVAWGDFVRGNLLFDVISPIPGVRTHRLSSENMIPFVTQLFEGWCAKGSAPYLLESKDGFALGQEALECLPIRAVRRMRSAVVHGVKDVRGKHDCLYVFLSGTPPEDGELLRRSIELLLPHIDLALRRLSHVDSQLALRTVGKFASLGLDSENDLSPVGISDLGLSLRQLEIMEWVRLGKTNQEIGQILDISMFTVKNHLQRVFKKLDVLNRAQAVARLSPNKRDAARRANV
jgi:transcriptional regulator EpsA